MEGFWKPEPREPWHDWRTYSMLGPIAAGALGACIFFALGLAFAEIVNIRAEVRKPLIFVASFGVAIGATFGSIGSGIEVFRKSHKGEAKSWDWVSLGISTVTTIVGMIIGVATLLGGTTNWSQQAVIWGSAAVCGFAALDAAGDMIELGGLFGSYEERVEQWRAEREAWRVSTGQSVTANGQEIVTKLSQLETAISQLNHRWAWPTATAADVNRATAHLNGDRANLTREELGVILAEHQLNLPSPSTVKRGLG
jgi:hypothetical protein